ncbi:hypothetical protein KJ854_01710 [Patescibacteria group bacterium]|nr:hypothetical protein [Patescibacteria group bacterium]MBU4141890.1 hypothetical protein [Patescibacteria group bacterium]
MRFANKIIILFLLFAAVSINASGVTINPSKIDLAVKINKPSSEKITITNPTSDVQIFKAYPDDFPDIIKTNPASFTLEAGAEKTVAVTVEIKDGQNSLGIFNTNISVVAKPLAETGFQTNAGVKIPLSISIIASENNFPSRVSRQTYYNLAIIVLFGIGALEHFVLRKKRMSA